MKKERKTNIELLRIIAMILIISFHYVYKSNFTFEELSVNSFIVKVFYMFGELGVNLFILITGYFMVTGKFSVKKLIYLIIEVNFYYLLSILIGQKLGTIQLTTAKDYMMIFFPTIHARYWFITAYIIVYILSPYLNILIQNMKKKEYQRLLMILLLIWCIIPTIFGVFYNTTENMLFYSRLIWLIVMYLVGAYIKLYPIEIFSKKRNSILCAILTFACMLVSIVIIYKFKNIFEKLGTTEIAYFWTPNTMLMFLLSVSIFEIFLNIKMKSIKIVNIIASTTLGIYMIHDGVLQRYIWDTIFKTTEHLSNNSWKIIIDIMIATIIIFIAGTIIDLIRQFIEKITIKKILDLKIFNRKSEEK
jgi:surface polysaccharide O-acyltransferase-like enzyme